MIRFLILLLILIGCSGTRQITNLYDKLPKKEAARKEYKTVDSFLKHTFTDAAYEKLKDIPLIDGPAYTAYVSGVNIWSNIASFFTFNGVGRKVIIPKDKIKKWGIKGLIHEYLHHLDDMTRDGEGNFINYDEFKKAYVRMSRDTFYAGIVIYTERQADRFFTNVFGIGHMSEHIAYSASHVYLHGGPDYFKKVFRKIFRKWEQ